MLERTIQERVRLGESSGHERADEERRDDQ